MKSFLIRSVFRVNAEISKSIVLEEELRVVLAYNIADAVLKAVQLGKRLASEYGKNWLFLGLLDVQEAPKPENGALLLSMSRETVDQEGFLNYLRNKNLHFQLYPQLN